MIKTFRILVGITGVFGSICCSIDSSKEEFKDYLKAIPSINLPLKVSCRSDLKPALVKIEDRLINKFGISNTQIYGKLKISERYTAVIYLLPANQYMPVIKTTDNSGNPIDTLYLLGNCGINEECIYANSVASITPDLVINITDTTKTCALDTLDHPKPGSEKLTVENRRFSINEIGKVVEYK